MRKLFTLSVVLIVAACATEKTPPQAAKDSATATTPVLPAGEATLAVDGGNIWYKVSGATGTATPVILLHGGPGYGSFYLKPMEGLSADRPVVRYDQLGNGKSDRLTDTTKMNIAHFVAELEALRAKLGYEQVHIVGHSWGTILGYEYYKAHPTHVASLTLMSAALNIPAWEANAKRLLKQLPDSSQQAITAADKTGKYEGPAYEAANGEFMSRFVVRHIRQADWDSTTKMVGMEQYMYFQGPSEFTIIGTLKQYNVTAELKNIAVPTLFTVGEFDEANPATIKKQAATVTGAKVVVIDTAAHLTMWDNEPQTLQAVRAFLKSVDAGPVKK
ncbi:MAG: proline iminopeptidase-family hydrolase [Gemmatimonadaceae bacterium]|nr:proline iminopeptidase-family hydrolase [Gemmatimonadaceae bacterium]